MKSWLMLKLYRTTANWSMLHQLVRIIYLYSLLPLLGFLVKRKFSFITQIIPRNSLLEGTRFNAFLSDIDLTVVILDNHDTKKLLKDFIKIKNILPMLDIPEVYFESEYQDRLQIQLSTSSPIIDVFWHIRKINWNLQKISANPSYLEKEKCERSIKYSFSKITSSTTSKDIYFKALNFINAFSESNESPVLCFFSPYLETNNKHSLKIVLNYEEFKCLDYLMPDYPIDSNKFPALKKAIIKHEELITIASIRIDEALEKSTFEKYNWANFLKGQINY